VLSIPSREYYPYLLDTINSRNGLTTLEERKSMALASFAVSSHYDSVIYNHFAGAEPPELRVTAQHAVALRYGENPHQSGTFFGNLDDVFEQLHGKALSYNNLLDLDAGIRLISDFQETTFAILKHNNACGLASRPQLLDAWKDALAGDPVSAFGGVLITNQPVDKKTAAEINKIFFEVILAPDYETEALEIFKTKKNRIILKKKAYCFKPFSIRTALNGILQQQVDNKTEQTNDLRPVTDKKPEENQRDDLIFANKVVKHSRSNAIVLVKNKQLFASGVGQTSRIDALKQAIDKANHFGFDLKGAVLASDAFFPFADSVELAHQAGITAVIQPGGSVRDKDSIEYCNKNGLAMVFTGNRHFKH
jgi:phosphoribosylaminoimidazolecarboxamide formyltransferase/IMP cyclohydrolase